MGFSQFKHEKEEIGRNVIFMRKSRVWSNEVIILMLQSRETTIFKRFIKKNREF